jgi:hypothetical protein
LPNSWFKLIKDAFYLSCVLTELMRDLSKLNDLKVRATFLTTNLTRILFTVCLINNFAAYLVYVWKRHLEIDRVILASVRLVFFELWQKGLCDSHIVLSVFIIYYINALNKYNDYLWTPWQIKMCLVQYISKRRINGLLAWFNKPWNSNLEFAYLKWKFVFFNAFILDGQSLRKDQYVRFFLFIIRTKQIDILFFSLREKNYQRCFSTKEFISYNSEQNGICLPLRKSIVIFLFFNIQNIRNHDTVGFYLLKRGVVCIR